MSKLKNGRNRHSDRGMRGVVESFRTAANAPARGPQRRFVTLPDGSIVAADDVRTLADYHRICEERGLAV